jgi:hypothetical protein
MTPNVGIFSLDPGGKSGLAWGIFDPTASLADALANGLHKGSATAEGDEYDQIRAITEEWTRFYRMCVNECCMDPEAVEFICEDFVQRPNSSGGKEGQSPIRIMWGVEGYRMGRAAEFKGRARSKVKIYAPRMILQHPSQASALGTRKRLESWDCWVVGREHERSAFAHIAVRLARIQSSRPSRG